MTTDPEIVRPLGFSAVVTCDFIHTDVEDVDRIVAGLANAGYVLRMKSLPMHQDGSAAPHPDGVIAGRLVFARSVYPVVAPPEATKIKRAKPMHRKKITKKAKKR